MRPLASADASVPALTLALNSDDVQFAARGLDGVAAYKSLAGQLFGIRLANSVAHNQTNDEIVCSTVEKAYSQSLTPHLRPCATRARSFRL